MLHHISFSVTDIERSARFYDAALRPLGYVRVWTDSSAIGYGRPGGGDKFALKLDASENLAPRPRFHLAFCAPSPTSVDEFHQAALEAGGKDNGAPGPRNRYGPHYYAAFVIDPDGYRIEAVVNVPA